MDPTPPAPAGAAESANCLGGGCPHCGALAAVAADPDMQALGELVAIGMDLARAVHKQLIEAKWLGVDGPAMFERISLAVRRTVALRLKLSEALLARRHREAARHAAEAAQRQRTRAERKQQVRTEVEEAIAAEAAPSVMHELRADLHEWLNDADRDENFDRKSVGEMVRAICKAFGITSDMPNYPHRLAERTDLIRDIGKDPPADPPAEPTDAGVVRPPVPPDRGGGTAPPPGPAPRDGTGLDPPDTG